MTLTIPIKLLNEAQGHIVSLELTNGVSYRGKLTEAEDNMNVQLKDAIIVGKDGTTEKASQVYIRGSQIQFFSLPDILVHAPMFESSKGKTLK
ncbi:small nuclear ribonucleoprotein Sm D3 [Pichia californica]|nr:small nuclear ribonucleoprotein Sm D3 [[Candida] californica]